MKYIFEDNDIPSSGEVFVYGNWCKIVSHGGLIKYNLISRSCIMLPENLSKSDFIKILNELGAMPSAYHLLMKYAASNIGLSDSDKLLRK